MKIESILHSLNGSDGATHGTVMGDSTVRSKVLTRNVEKLITTIVETSCRPTRDCVFSNSTKDLVRSLAVPFCAYFSLRTEWFSQRDFRRLLRSMGKIAVRIHSMENDMNREQSYIKYWLDLLMCKLFKDHQEPVRDDWNTVPLFSGFCKMVICRALARRDVSFIYSLQKGAKQSWPQMSELKKLEAFKKHAERLGRPQVVVNPDILAKVESISQRVFTIKAMGPRVKFLPTGSACLQASRENGGALSLVQRFHYPDAMEERTIGKLRALQHGLEQWRVSQFKHVSARAVEDITLNPLDSSSLCVDVVALPEPGKFRMITKGDGYLYSALQPLQGQMISAWKKQWQSTMLDQDLTEKVRTIDRKIDFMPSWISGDYEAATDLLNKSCTMAVMNGLPDIPDVDVGIYSCSMAKVRYPKSTGIGEVEALEGQLMGHPLSFPQLCVINAAVYHVAVDRWAEFQRSLGRKERELRTKVRLMKKYFLVNGDDILFKGDSYLFRLFNLTAKEAGFKASVGKNYFSPDVCMINSQTFRRVTFNGKSKMRRFSYLNQRFVFGVNIKQDLHDGIGTPLEVAVGLNTMCEELKWSRCVIPLVFKRWKQHYFGPMYRPNWYLPVHLGGFGLNPEFAPASSKVTYGQRKMASRFINEPGLVLYRKHKMSIPTAKYAGSIASWKMVQPYYTPNVHETFSEEDEWLMRIAYAARAHEGSKRFNDAMMVCKFKPDYVLKPISNSGFVRYWRYRLIRSHLPVCPSVGVLPRIASY